jgi:hypothetical protein
MLLKSEGHGIIHYVNENLVISSRGNHLIIKKEKEYLDRITIPLNISDRIWTQHKWLSRLSRKENSHVIEIDEGRFACIAFGNIFIINIDKKEVNNIGEIKGSRPLCVCTDRENIYYGIYRNNVERKPIELLQYSTTKKSWNVFYRFEEIRHIHGVFWDRYESKLWVTTGDLDHESTIWKFENAKTPKKIVAGSQQTRAVDLLFTEGAIFYATDAPNDSNFIYKLDRMTHKLDKLQKVGGPVFYGRKDGKWLFFGTVVEPSEVNRTDAVELWGSPDEGNSWKLIREFKKDILHKKLFQYGQIKFPSGPGDGKNLYFTPYATEFDHNIMKLPLDEL